MNGTMERPFQPNWDLETMRGMSDEELISHYHEIKYNLNLVDTHYLTEICARNLLNKLN